MQLHRPSSHLNVLERGQVLLNQYQRLLQCVTPLGSSVLCPPARSLALFSEIKLDIKYKIMLVSLLDGWEEPVGNGLKLLK